MNGLQNPATVWQTLHDPKTNKPYYYNPQTKITTFIVPDDLLTPAQVSRFAPCPCYLRVLMSFCLACDRMGQDHGRWRKSLLLPQRRQNEDVVDPARGVGCRTCSACARCVCIIQLSIAACVARPTGSARPTGPETAPGRKKLLRSQR